MNLKHTILTTISLLFYMRVYMYILERSKPRLIASCVIIIGPHNNYLLTLALPTSDTINELMCANIVGTFLKTKERSKLVPNRSLSI